MKINQTSIFVLLLTLTCSYQVSYGQKWVQKDETKLASRNLTRDIIPNKYDFYKINIESLRKNLKNAPERFRADGKAPITINIPNAKGEITQFDLKRSDVFHPDLAARYPEIQSYTGTNAEDPTSLLKLSISQKGMNAMILSDQHPTLYIDPYARETDDHYIVYSKNDFEKHLHDGEGHCTVEHPDDNYKAPKNNDARYGDCQLRKYRLALACTGEYANFHGGTVASVLAEFNASLTRVNGIYEREFTITMELIANTDELIYFNGSTDPYTNNSGGTMLGENQQNIDAVIGFNNYDIGHVYSTGGGGIASLRSPCTTRKARGVTGLNNPSGDPFWVDYVAHEIGHQFGGNHTYNNSCGGNINNSTAFEPGSGSTIMAYAGICSPNVQNNSDDYFHSISLQEVANFVVAGNGGCAETITIENSAPELDPLFGNGLVLPISTPFVLDAIASDADGDALTYCWEQMDNQMADMPPMTDNSSGPAFRSFDPTSSSQRYFPRLPSILFGTNGNTWERLPSVSRSMNFNLAVRDNNEVGGCTTDDNLSISFTNEAGPFEVTSQNATVSWGAGGVETITWDVANTDQAPVSCATVDIFLSTDGGENFDILLADDAENNGSLEINVPFLFSDDCRLMIKCSTSIFLDINDADFSIIAPFSSTISPANIFACQGEDAIYSIDYIEFAEGTEASFMISGLPVGAAADFSQTTATEDATIQITISGTENIIPGEYPLTVTTASNMTESTTDVTLTISSDQAPTLVPLSPENGAQNVAVNPTLTWQDDPTVEEYTIEISESPLFDEITYSQTTNSAAVTGLVLMTETVYYWRLLPISSCYQSDWGSTQSFQTKGLDCNNYMIEANIDIPTEVTSVSSIINIDEDEAATNLSVFIKVDHTWVGDLIAELTSPSGTTVVLFDQPGVPADDFGCGNDNLEVTFSDSAPNTASTLENTCEPGGLAISGDFQPLEALSTFDGESTMGDWTLTIFDTFDDDGGELVEWSLTTCKTISIEPAVIINNTTLTLSNETNKIIEPGNLQVESSIPMMTVYTLRSLPVNGDLEIMNIGTGEFEAVIIGATFSQSQIDDGMVRYQSTNFTNNSDDFLFDVLDDQNRYLSDQTFTIITNFEGLVVISTISNEVSCFGSADGEITAMSSGGIEPYMYSIDGENFSSDNVFSGLTSGSYTITSRDNNGNESTSSSIIIEEPELIIINLDFGINTVSVNAQGGTGGYQYALNGGDFVDANVFEVEDGEVYTFSVRDENDCIINTGEFPYYFISDATLEVVNVDCFGGTTGSITVTSIDGGLSPYEYNLNEVNNTTGIFEDLAVGTYDLEINDSAENTYTVSIEILEPDELSATATVSQDSIFAIGMGGTAPYTYSLDGENFSTESVLIGIVGEIYTVTIMDANGCTTSIDGIEIISSVSNPQLDAMSLFPNPAVQSITFGSDQVLQFDYDIRDISGRILIQDKGNTNEIIEVRNLSKGMYLVNVLYDGGRRTFRLAKVD